MCDKCPVDLEKETEQKEGGYTGGVFMVRCCRAFASTWCWNHPGVVPLPIQQCCKSALNLSFPSPSHENFTDNLISWL